MALYGNLGYDARILETVVAKLGKKTGERSFFLLCGSAVFSCNWEKDKISDDEIYKYANSDLITFDHDDKNNNN